MLIFGDMKLNFTCDYTEGAHPRILQRFMETNLQQEAGYGLDSFTCSARERIRRACGCPEADVFFLVGGTQTNATVIDAVLRPGEGVLAATSGHIAVHEAGAVESAGHKVLTLPAEEGKFTASALQAYLERFFADAAWEHMVAPGMVYLSFPTEYGTLYTKEELSAIRRVSQAYKLPLFLDGARLGYGLASPACDLSLEDIAHLTDVFYIGGTKVGALCGEAVVFPRGNAPRGFFTTVKRHGALLAKGRLTGIQFDTLFDGNLYFDIAQNAIDQAFALKALFQGKGIPLFIDSPTNQQFPILTAAQVEALQPLVDFEIWEPLPDGRLVTRFATSWATTPESIGALAQILASV